ncbi:hypothetical protein LWI29_028029 [Acer saccharum]|uniref:CLAVATA3/ESR (CLE)-related protein 25-like n=1 Tax=Acer saccharum TaxID=4024 RepID=A0AA39S9T8_ACESA|nr:hypothetical protein LWI29_028029 [Acer saccharum]KAK1563036.1 hypothetical protein Q3G72_021231 [Acer saccharum]
MLYQADFLKFGMTYSKILCAKDKWKLLIEQEKTSNQATAETMTTTRTRTTTTTTVTMKVPSTENFKQRKLIAREKNQHHTHHQDSDLNYVSKRRVPNGPDPIHNRRASKARQPPGRI